MISAKEARELMETSAIQLIQYNELMNALESAIELFCMNGAHTFTHCLGKEDSMFKQNIIVHLGFYGYVVEDVSTKDSTRLKISW